MGAPAGFEFTPGGTWSFGSTRGEWSPSVCGCGSGSCLCGGSCWCKGGCGGPCGGGKPSGEVLLLPDYDGDILASSETWIDGTWPERDNVTFDWDKIRYDGWRGWGANSDGEDSQVQSCCCCVKSLKRVRHKKWSDIDPKDPVEGPVFEAVESARKAREKESKKSISPPGWVPFDIWEIVIEYKVAKTASTSRCDLSVIEKLVAPDDVLAAMDFPMKSGQETVMTGGEMGKRFRDRYHTGRPGSLTGWFKHEDEEPPCPGEVTIYIWDYPTAVAAPGKIELVREILLRSSLDCDCEFDRLKVLDQFTADNPSSILGALLSSPKLDVEIGDVGEVPRVEAQYRR